MWKSDEIEVWIGNNKLLVKTRSREVGQHTIMEFFSTNLTEL